MTEQATRVVPAGWYDDPASPDRVRWWNGLTWTEHVTEKPSRPQLVDAQSASTAASSTAASSSVTASTVTAERSNVTPLTRRELHESGAATTAADTSSVVTGAQQDAAEAERARQLAESRRLEQQFGVGTSEIPSIEEAALDETYRGQRVDAFQHREEAPTRPRRADTGTAGSAGIVLTPLLAAILGLAGAYVYFYVQPVPLLLFAPVVAYLLAILFAISDARTLRRRGFAPPSPLFALGTPLVYLIARRVKVPGSGPLVAFILLAALLPALGAAAVAFGPASGVATALDVQQQLSAELIGNGSATSVTCPMVLESTAPGTVYECDVVTPDGQPEIVYVGIGDEPGTFNFAFKVR